jgi:hypothetical protein
MFIVFACSHLFFYLSFIFFMLACHWALSAIESLGCVRDFHFWRASDDAGIPLFALLRLPPPVALDRPLSFFSKFSLGCGPLLLSSACTLKGEGELYVVNLNGHLTVLLLFLLANTSVLSPQKHPCTWRLISTVEAARISPDSVTRLSGRCQPGSLH